MAEKRKKKLTIVMDAEVTETVPACLALVVLHGTNKLVFSYVTTLGVSQLHVAEHNTLNQSVYSIKMIETDWLMLDFCPFRYIFKPGQSAPTSKSHIYVIKLGKIQVLLKKEKRNNE